MARADHDNIFPPDMCMDPVPPQGHGQPKLYRDRNTGLLYNPLTKCVWREQTRKWVKVSGNAAKDIEGVISNVCLEHPRDPRRKPFQPKEHQLSALNRFRNVFEANDPTLKGILVMHGLGSGKTCTYALCADYYLKNVNSNRQNVYVFTSGALRANFIQQYCSFCGTITRNMLDRFHFYSHNSTTIREILQRAQREKPGFLNNSLIIIDEVHNVINGRVHESEQKSAVYEFIQTAKDSFIVCGSGTPIVGDYKELFYLLLLLRPTLIPDLNTFNSMFGSRKGVIIPKDIQAFRDILHPVVDYYTATGDSSHYPEVFIKYLNIPINPRRLDAYIKIREDEIDTLPPNERDRIRNPDRYNRDRTRYFLALSMLRSRQESNFQYPEIQVGDQIGTPIELRIDDKLIGDGGWITPEILSVIPEYSEKLTYIISDILNNPYKHVIYTKFKLRYGSYLIGALLDLYGISYEFFNGDMDDQDRVRVLEKFNAPGNIKGQQIRVMIITDAGAEGINLLHVRKFHILEQYISRWVIKQAIGRAIRYDSHVALDIPDRNVTVINYMLDLGRGLDYNLYYSSDYRSLAFGLNKEISISFIVDFLSHLDSEEFYTSSSEQLIPTQALTTEELDILPLVESASIISEQ